MYHGRLLLRQRARAFVGQPLISEISEDRCVVLMPSHVENLPRPPCRAIGQQDAGRLPFFMSGRDGPQQEIAVPGVDKTRVPADACESGIAASLEFVRGVLGLVQ